MSKPEPWRDPQAVPFIRIEDVSKSFDGVTAVDRVHLDIYRGELFALLGGSGCGKTTLLRMLAGFERPTRGHIFIDGQSMADVPPYERPVNMMFQSYALFPHMTVESNVAFGLRQDRVPGPEIRRRVAEALELVQLGGFGKRKPHQLSGGQRQRVALARSLVKRPKVLLLDEPLGALDKKLREQTQFELVNIQSQVGITFVMVTHDQDEAMAMSSRIAVMDKGRIVQCGTPNEIYEFPGSRMVADFVGSVNMFEGRLAVDEPDHAVIVSEEAGTEIHIGHGISGAVGATLWVAVRPEKLRVSRTPLDGAANQVSGIVRDIAYHGNLSVYNVTLDSGKAVRVTAPNLDRWSELTLGREERVWLTWAADAGVVLAQ